MRVASYNILDGGEGRADPIAEILLAQRADVIGVVEADNPGVLQRLSQRLSMDFVVAQGQTHAVALFSRWDIDDTINLAAIHPEGPRCLLRAEVIDRAGKRWTIGVLHLSPRADDADEAVRERELAVALHLFAGDRAAGDAHLLMGDFNANSPVQRIDPARLKPKSRESWDRNGGKLPRRAVQMLLDVGYVDTLSAADPAAAGITGSFTTQHPGQRVDYIFASGVPRECIRAAWVEQDRLATYASDHYPVGCELS